MTRHVADDIADFLEGRLSQARGDDVEKHLMECPECAAQFAFVRKFREGAIAQGLAHISPDRLLTLAEGPALVTPVEMEHLDTCASCRRDLNWVKSRPGEDAVAAPVSALPETKRRRLFSRGWLAVAATVAAVVSAMIWLLPRGGEQAVDMARLARVEPLPVQLSRGEIRDDFERARIRGFEAYRDGRYAVAAEFFAGALKIRSEDAEMLLYLGSAELLQGEAKRAVAHLETGAGVPATAAIHAERLWHLANARLLLGQRDAAEAALGELMTIESPRREDAQSLLERLKK